MLEQEQKRYLAIIVLLILVLGGLSFWHQGDNKNQQLAITKTPATTGIDQATYDKYLAALKIDPVASQEVFQQIITPDDVNQEVDSDLQTNQQIVTPSIDEKSIPVTNDQSQKAFVSYFSNTTGIAGQLTNAMADTNDQLFAQPTVGVVEPNINSFSQLYSDMSKQQTPKDALAAQKALLVAYTAYGNLLNVAKDYVSGTNDTPWPKVYNAYVVANDQATNYRQEVEKISNKYNLANIPIFPYYARNDIAGPFQIKQAYAVFGVGDTTITLGDIPRIIMDAVGQGFETAYDKFMLTFLGKMVSKVEQNYKIANYLYYTDALVSGQYVNDYLNKYVSDNLDKVVIQRFIPQISCGLNNSPVAQAALKALYQSKAQANLGFDPNTLDPNDPDYFTKMAKLGDFLSSPTGWQYYYQDVAGQAQNKAEQAAQLELTSSGVKSPRSAIDNQIAVSLDSISNSQKATINSLMNLGGTSNKDFISGLVATITQTLLTQFVFPGASGGSGGTAPGGSFGVLKEQSTCLAGAMINPIIPVASSTYSAPTNLLANQAGAQAIQCSSSTSGIPDSNGKDTCQDPTLSTLQTCANNYSKLGDNDKQTCHQIATSPYITIMLSQCSPNLAKQATYCNQLMILSPAQAIACSTTNGITDKNGQDTCVDPTLNALQTCAKNYSILGDADKQTCSQLANSSYINYMLGQCSNTTSAKQPTYCSNLQSLLKTVH